MPLRINLPFFRLGDWKDEAELKRFLSRDNTDKRLFLRAGKSGRIRFNNQCEDRAIRLIDNAARWGKRLFFVPLHKAEYYKWYKKRIPNYHAICGALVGDNEFWYIEPEDDSCWRALFLD